MEHSYDPSDACNRPSAWTCAAHGIVMGDFHRDLHPVSHRQCTAGEQSNNQGLSCVQAYVDYSKQDTVVRQFESRIRSWGADLKGMEDEVAKQTDLIASITKDSESDQQVRSLQRSTARTHSHLHMPNTASMAWC